MFYDIYCELCRKAGLTPSGAASKIGFNRSSVTVWKTTGKAPKQDLLIKIASFFSVSTDYLLGTEPEKAPSEVGEGSIPHAQYREVLAEGGIRLMLDTDANVPQEHIDDIVEFIKFKQRKNGR